MDEKGVINNVSDVYSTPGTQLSSIDQVSADLLLRELVFDELFSSADLQNESLFKNAGNTQIIDPKAVNLAALNRTPEVMKTVPIKVETKPDGEQDGEPVTKKPKVTTDARRKVLNRINAKNSRIRNKFKVESLLQKVEELQRENEALKAKIETKLNTGEQEEEQPAGNAVEVSSEDYNLLDCLIRSKSNFCLTDPHEPDNPIINASSGFYEMTGYSPSEVLGKNCRFLQGPGTRPETVATVRAAMEKGEPVAVTMLNYRKDGSHFWNQVYISPIMGPDGESIVHFIGVQREIVVKNLPDSVVSKANTKFKKTIQK